MPETEVILTDLLDEFSVVEQRGERRQAEPLAVGVGGQRGVALVRRVVLDLILAAEVVPVLARHVLHARQAELVLDDLLKRAVLRVRGRGGVCGGMGGGTVQSKYRFGCEAGARHELRAARADHARIDLAQRREDELPRLVPRQHRQRLRVGLVVGELRELQVARRRQAVETGRRAGNAVGRSGRTSIEKSDMFRHATPISYLWFSHTATIDESAPAAASGSSGSSSSSADRTAPAASYRLGSRCSEGVLIARRIVVRGARPSRALAPVSQLGRPRWRQGTRGVNCLESKSRRARRAWLACRCTERAAPRPGASSAASRGRGARARRAEARAQLRQRRAACAILQVAHLPPERAWPLVVQARGAEGDRAEVACLTRRQLLSEEARVAPQPTVPLAREPRVCRGDERGYAALVDGAARAW